jgi:hypothetical protein
VDAAKIIKIASLDGKGLDISGRIIWEPTKTSFISSIQNGGAFLRSLSPFFTPPDLDMDEEKMESAREGTPPK